MSIIVIITKIPEDSMKEVIGWEHGTAPCSYSFKGNIINNCHEQKVIEKDANFIIVGTSACIIEKCQLGCITKLEVSARTDAGLYTVENVQIL